MIAGLAPWGHRPTPLLPEAFRDLWKECLPEWLAEELCLPVGVTFDALGSEFWNEFGQASVSGRVRSFVIQTVKSRLAELLAVCPIRRTWPKSLDPRQVPFSVRTMNCLEREGLLDDPSRMTNLSVQDLLKIKAMGVISILDFSCITESVLGPRGDRLLGYAGEAGDLLSVVDEAWVDQVSAEDPRFADVIPIGVGTLYERIDRITLEPQDPPLEERQVTAALPAIRRRIGDLSALSLERALRQLVESVSCLQGKRLHALERRLGTDGKLPATLEESAAIIGVTRERMRQLQQRFLQRLPRHAIFLPQLDRALELVTNRAPCLAAAAEAMLKQAQISLEAFDVRSLAECGELLGRTVSFEVAQDPAGATRVRKRDSGRIDAAVRTTAHRQASASGASNVEQVVAELQSNHIQASVEHVLSYLASSSEFEFLDAAWYWYPSAPQDRNRLQNLTRKMLSVASPISVGELREGVQRHYHVRSSRGISKWPIIVPPKAVLLKFYSSHPEFSVDADGNVSSPRLLNHRTELNPTELVLVEAIRSSPSQVLDRASLARRCVDQQGMNGNTFSQFLSSSAVISHLGTDLWSLRGVRVDPAAVEAARQANALRPREKRIIDHGWTDAGDLWIAARVPQETTRFVMGVPAPIRHVLVNQEYQAVDDLGIPSGIVRTNAEGMSYGGGYGSFLTRRGADEGDLLLATFRLTQRQVELRLVDDDALEAISPGGD